MCNISLLAAPTTTQQGVMGNTSLLAAPTTTQQGGCVTRLY